MGARTREPSRMVKKMEKDAFNGLMEINILAAGKMASSMEWVSTTIRRMARRSRESGQVE